MGSKGAVVQAEDGGGPKVVKRQTSAREVLELAGRLSPPSFSVHGRGGRICAGARCGGGHGVAAGGSRGARGRGERWASQLSSLVPCSGRASSAPP